MFIISWIKSFFQPKKQDFDYSTYKPEEQLIYSYWNGKDQIKADPLVLYKRMLDIRPELNADLKCAGSPLKDASKFHDEAVKKINKIFDIKPYSEGGLTQIDTMDLFNHFLIFTEGVKKNGSQTQTSQKEISPTTKSLSEESPPIQNTSDSGSTEKEPVTEKQMPSQQPSESPSASVPPETTTGKQ
jgi:hypothetical protein